MLADTSHIFWTVVASANVVISSTNKLSQAVIGSPALYVSLSTMLSALAASTFSSSINHSSNFHWLFSTTNLFSSHDQLDVFTILQGLTTSSAPVLPVVVLVHNSASVAICTLPATDVLASGVGVPVSAVSRCTVVPL